MNVPNENMSTHVSPGPVCNNTPPPLQAVFGRPFKKPRDGFSLFQWLLLSSPVISSLHRLRLGAVDDQRSQVTDTQLAPNMEYFTKQVEEAFQAFFLSLCLTGPLDKLDF